MGSFQNLTFRDGEQPALTQCFIPCGMRRGDELGSHKGRKSVKDPVQALLSLPLYGGGFMSLY